MFPFAKGHGLGNDYIVLDVRHLPINLTPKCVALLCDRHCGIGGDGILLHTFDPNADVGLRIYNPDGSEAEKSGNGLRIFAAYLFQTKQVGDTPFSISIMGGKGHATAQVFEEKGTIKVEMGQASLKPQSVPTTLPGPKVIDVPLEVEGTHWPVCCVGVGNPHCVIFVEDVDAIDLSHLGPLIENHRVFPRRTNVQLAQIIDAHEIKVRIWERGAGLTNSSGSSASAVAAAAVQTGRAKSPITVKMLGGDLNVGVDGDLNIEIEGPAVIVMRGEIGADLLRELVGLG